MAVDPKKAKEVFLSTIENFDPEQWSAFLDKTCGDDSELRQRVESLLAAHQGKDRLFDDPDVALITTGSFTEVTEGCGAVIGRYKLLEKIGEGGMAVVYMAEQTEPILRKVALKIIKLGMDTKSVIARFEAERHALALMDHPNIAKVLDAGATETGRPYFVMELVTGVSITEYCDKNNLSTKERLALFIQVCNAIQHAHQKGIIHRDIKPTNVMVTLRDGQPMPKVIDFGIAKAINQKLTEKTLFTRYAHIIGTPAYMSPEQAELSELDIDTRTDIYSLGVLLYELLTGTTPFGEEELRKAGYIEMQRIIREQEPTKPSTKLSTLSNKLTDIAKHRSATPDILRKTVRGDLDWIVMKSLEKDRSRRYETANSLALDIRHHLEHEPVVARGPSTTYRMQKFLRRHRSQTIAALAILIIAVAVVVILSMWNQDRLQLAEAEGFRHRGILSQARELYAKAEREAALETIKPILSSKHVGPEAQLLQAGILIDNRRSDEAVTILSNLLNERPEIAGAAHSLLARILWESESPNTEKLKEIEEHRRKAEQLLPETAEAYFLRAMTAITVKEQLGSLDKALQLDPSHYESRRLRAFTYYASRKYEKMRDDALVMSVSRPRDPLGYSLRAAALRELGKYTEAIEQYDRTIALTPRGDTQYIDLSTQRCETLLKMGDYKRLISDAEACLKLIPDKPIFQYYIFSALTALGNYDNATTLFRQIIKPGHEARQQFQNWCAKYIFDTLDAGRSWHPVDSEPAGVAFLPIVEAEEIYNQLSTKARCVIKDGFTARYSLDGKKIAFSTGFHGYSGLALYDVETGQTDLLIVPGKDPSWSPDGRYLAFVRDCSILPVPELASAERINRHRAYEDEEVWIINSDGTEPRRLATGGWPSWSSDGKHIYYQSPKDKKLYKISIEKGAANTQAIMPCSDRLFAISPDEKYVAYSEGQSLRVVELASQKVVTELTLPFNIQGQAWSLDSRELCFGTFQSTNIRFGLWTYDLDQRQPKQVLVVPSHVTSLAPDGTRMLFNVQAPYFEIWVADLDPDAGIVGSLGPGQTLEEHLHKILDLYTQRIEGDPEHANNYYLRAQCHDYLGDRASANADMRRWSAVASGEQPSDLPFATRPDFTRALSLPFDYELVFSAERPVNTIPMMSFAFGQKGRCKMKLFKIPMFITSMFGICLVSGLDAPPVYANFTFGEPTNLGPVVNSSYWEAVQSISADGLTLYFGEIPPNVDPSGYGGGDIWVTMRNTIDDEWGPRTNLGPPVNTSSGEGTPCISADGLSLYFTSYRVGGYGSLDLWVTTRETTSDPWGEPENLGSTVNSPADEAFPSISADGLELYFSDYMVARPGGSWDLWVTTRATTEDDWGPPENLGDTVNHWHFDGGPFISADSLTLFFTSVARPAGLGGDDIWMTRRATDSESWCTPVNLGPPINSPFNDGYLSLSANGSTLYFSSDRSGGSGGYDLWQAEVHPVVDLNGDGIVDCADMCIIVDNWGTNEPLCDIGPTPFGDGIVDVQDLIALAEHLFEEIPPAESVE
jgi:serine/threonine protein kinase/Tol biopolymer transport system component